jgi:WD40 repeat protein
MNTSDQKAQQIFASAIGIHDTAERGAFLDRACGNNAALRQEVDSLLAAHYAAGDFLQCSAPPVGAVAAQRTMIIPTLSETTGTRIDRYKLLERIGEGGFGVVWMAEQEEPVRRRVALKIIKLGMDTREVVARFEAERQALAMMDHPNIASVFDGGATAAGRPYFVMELVKGVPITDYCDANQLSTQDRLRLFMQVCHAVQHAHQKGVIHRDLKPSNILVTVKDDQPVPKVIDFGVAKATQARLTEKTLFTSLRQWIGTPAYMSPEQAGLGSFDVDTRSDLYSLGVLLYELLTGVTPFDRETFARVALDEIRRMIRETEPAIPSTRLQTLGQKLTEVARHRNTEPAALSRLIRGDLDWIVMKCLEKDRRRRYETPSELAADIQRHLSHEPVSAVAPSLGYRLEKLVRRHRAAVAVAAGFAVLLLLTAVVSTSLAIYAQGQKARALRAEAVSSDNLYAADMGLVKQALDKNQLAHARELLRAHIPAPGQSDRRGVEWRHLWSRSRGQQLAILPFPKSGTINTLGFTPDNSFLLVGTSSGRLSVVRFEDFKVLCATNVFTNAGCASLTISRDGHRVAVSGSAAGAVCIWELASDGSLSLLRRIQAESPYGLSFSPDGYRLAIGTEESFWTDDLERGGLTKLFDLNTGHELATLPQSGGRFVAFSPDGKWLATGPWHGWNVRLWNAATLRRERTIEMRTPIWLEFSTDSQTLLTGGLFDAAYYSTATADALAQLSRPGKNGGFLAGILLPGNRLAAAAVFNRVRLDDLQEHTFKELLGHEGEVRSLAVSADGLFLVSGDTSGKVLLWNVNGGYPQLARVREPHTAGVSSLPFPPSSPRGDKLALRVQSQIRILDGKTGRVGPRLPAAAYPLAFKDDDTVLAIRGLDFLEANNRLRKGWEVTNRPPLLEFWNLTSLSNSSVELTATGSREVSAVAISPRCDLVALAWRQGERTNGVVLLEPATGDVRFSAGGFEHRINGLAFSCTGRQLAVAMLSGGVQILEPPSAVPILKLTPGAHAADCAAFSPDDKLLAVGGWNGVRVWSLPEGREFPSRLSQLSGVTHVRFSASGRTLIGFGDHETKLWHIPTGRDLFEMGYEEPRYFLPLTGERYASVAYAHASAPQVQEWTLSELPPLDSAEEWLRAQPATLAEARQLLRPAPPEDLPNSFPAPRSWLQQVIPPRPPGASRQLIDLTSYYNGSLLKGWLPSSESGTAAEKNLGELPSGLQSFAGVQFDVRGVIQLSGNQLNDNHRASYPATVKGISVNQKCRNLHFLHGTGWSAPNGQTVGHYIIRYSDNSSEDIPLVYGENVADWWAQDAPAVSGVVAWTGKNFASRAQGNSVRLYKLAWANPRPDTLIAEIDLVSENSNSSPFLIAVTAEP